MKVIIYVGFASAFATLSANRACKRLTLNLIWSVELAGGFNKPLRDLMSAGTRTAVVSHMLLI
jgi:hypothetical protein